MSRKLVLGIDVGGTNVKFGLVNSSGKIFYTSRVDTNPYLNDKSGLIKRIIAECRHLLNQQKLNVKDIAGIGIGLPGLVDIERGIVKFLPNIYGWENVPLKSILEKNLGIKTFVDNDVKMMTLAEWKFGAGQGTDHLVCLTLGTGVGSGLILDGKLYRGSGGFAGELGHVPLNEVGPKCNCGGTACLERYVGNKYLLEKARKIFKNKTISLEELTQLADQKNMLALKFWAQTGEYIGLGLVSVVNLLNPKKIVVGGGVAHAFHHLQPSIIRTIRQRAMQLPSSMVQVVQAKLIDRAGILGALVLVDYAARSK